MNEVTKTSKIKQISPAPEKYYAKYLDIVEGGAKYIPIACIGLVEVEETVRGKGLVGYDLSPKALVLWEDGNLYPAEDLVGFEKILYDVDYYEA